MTTKQELPLKPFKSQAAWRKWLDEHHATTPGVLIKFAKVSSGVASLNYQQALEVALCYGWIDGQSKRIDDRFHQQRFTPRTKKSIWSKINRAKALALIDQGKMQPAGLREVERAKADGRWDAAYDSPKNSIVPDDLQRALDANPKAKAAFDKLNSQNRYAILFRLHGAKRPETRTRHIEKFVAMLAEGKKLYE